MVHWKHLCAPSDHLNKLAGEVLNGILTGVLVIIQSGISLFFFSKKFFKLTSEQLRREKGRKIIKKSLKQQAWQNHDEFLEIMRQRLADRCNRGSTQYHCLLTSMEGVTWAYLNFPWGHSGLGGQQIPRVWWVLS